MSLVDEAALVVSVITILGSLAAIVRWLVKHYLAELRPNGGGSIKDQVNTLEQQNISLNEKIDRVYDVLLEHISKNKN